MNNLPYFIINIGSCPNQTWYEDFEKSWDIYCSSILDNGKWEKSATLYNYIYKNARSWVYYIVHNYYTDDIHGAEFYANFKTPSFAFDVKLNIAARN